MGDHTLAIVAPERPEREKAEDGEQDAGAEEMDHLGADGLTQERDIGEQQVVVKQLGHGTAFGAFAIGDKDLAGIMAERAAVARGGKQRHPQRRGARQGGQPSVGLAVAGKTEQEDGDKAHGSNEERAEKRHVIAVADRTGSAERRDPGADIQHHRQAKRHQPDIDRQLFLPQRDRVGLAEGPAVKLARQQGVDGRLHGTLPRMGGAVQHALRL